MDLAIQAYDSPHTKAFLLLQAAGLGVAMGKTEHGDFDHPSYPKVSKDGVLELQYDGKHINIYLKHTRIWLRERKLHEDYHLMSGSTFQVEGV